jgi:hypothetical protein
MCNKALNTAKDIEIDFLEHEIQQISVDAEEFYSNHVITRKPDLLNEKELKQTFYYAMPHEFE